MTWHRKGAAQEGGNWRRVGGEWSGRREKSERGDGIEKSRKETEVKRDGKGKERGRRKARRGVGTQREALEAENSSWW